MCLFRSIKPNSYVTYNSINRQQVKRCFKTGKLYAPYAKNSQTLPLARDPIQAFGTGNPQQQCSVEIALCSGIPYAVANCEVI